MNTVFPLLRGNPTAQIKENKQIEWRRKHKYARMWEKADQSCEPIDDKTNE